MCREQGTACSAGEVASSARRHAPSKSCIRTCSDGALELDFVGLPFVMSGGVMYKGDLVAAPKSSRRPRLELCSAARRCTVNKSYTYHRLTRECVGEAAYAGENAQKGNPGAV